MRKLKEHQTYEFLKRKLFQLLQKKQKGREEDEIEQKVQKEIKKLNI